MKKVIVLYGHKAVIESAKKAGYYTINILEANMLLGTFIKATSISDQTYILKNLEELETLVKMITEHEEIDGIVSFTDTRNGVYNAARFNEIFLKQNNFLSHEMVEILNNKEKARNYFDNIGLASVPFSVPVSISDVQTFVADYNKSILKPVRGQGSEAVYLIEQDQDIPLLLAPVENKLKNKYFIIEKFIDGDEVSVESIVTKGNPIILGITKKNKISSFEKPHSVFVEKGHLFPISIEPIIDEKIYHTVHTIFDNLKANNVLGHTEIIIEKNTNQIYLVESHARAGGDSIPELIEIASGTSPYTLFFQALMGQSFDWKLNNNLGYIEYYIPPVGEIDTVVFESEFNHDHDKIKNRLVFSNKKVEPVTQSFERNWGYIIVSDANDPERVAADYLSNIQVIMKEKNVM